MTKPTVAVYFGGRSVEQPVSCASGSGVAKALRERGFDVTTIGITRSRRMGRTRPRTRLRHRIRPTRCPRSPPRPARPSRSTSAPARSRWPTSYFPVLHGPFGEDGTIQGLFEMAGVPYVGSGVLSSSLCMDKEFSKRLLAAEGVPQGAFASSSPARTSTRRPSSEARPADLRQARPRRLEPRDQQGQLGRRTRHAVEKAREVDEKVVFEAAFESVREIEMGVLETLDGDLEITFPLEVLAKGEDGWFDFEAKYLDNPEPFNLRPDYPEGVAEQAQALARKVFRLLDCRDLARVDCFLAEDGVVYLNEVNTMPGMTPMSGVPQAFAATGISYGELVERLVTLAAARVADANRPRTLAWSLHRVLTCCQRSRNTVCAPVPTVF